MMLCRERKHFEAAFLEERRPFIGIEICGIPRFVHLVVAVTFGVAQFQVRPRFVQEASL